MKLDEAIDLVIAETYRAASMSPSFPSPREGLVILLEEVEELKREVFANRSLRSNGRMRKEAVQVGAMAGYAFLWSAAAYLTKPIPCDYNIGVCPRQE